MFSFARTRRALTAITVLAAAGASLATSQPRWSLDADAEAPAATLSADNLEVEAHFTARSSEEHSFSLIGTLDWDTSLSDRVAAVQVTITPDQGTPTQETFRADEAEDASTSFLLSNGPPCAEFPCQHGYAVKFKLVDGHPGETVGLQFKARATISGDDKEPDDAFVELSLD